MRVLTRSSGWTTKVETAPAERPATDSTVPVDRPAAFCEGIEAGPFKGGCCYMLLLGCSGKKGSLR